jgi:2-dehydropantoate 2-reductase
MRICVFGAGAIGGLIGARLALQGEVKVSLVARGAHLARLRDKGLTLKDERGLTTVKVSASDRPQELGPQDYVFLALKAHSLPAIADSLKPLLGAETAVVTAQNGVPWWYFYKHGGVHEGLRIEAVDPGGRLWDAIDPARVIGCVVHPAAEIEAPGLIRHIEGDRLALGEPSGEKTERTAILARLLVAASFKAPIRAQIRNEIWVKLWGNLSLNPVSALTGGTLAQICSDPGTRAIIRAMMVEAQAIGESLGASFGVDVDRRIAGAEAVGAHKTSMLQDLERGRPIEVDALVTAVQELGRLTQQPTPTIDIVAALLRQRARLAGCL